MPMDPESQANENDSLPPSQQGGEENKDTEPERVEAALKKMEEKAPSVLQEFLALTASSNVNPLQNMMNEGHVTQTLEIAAKHDERSYDIACKEHSGKAKQNGSCSWRSLSSRRSWFLS